MRGRNMCLLALALGAIFMIACGGGGGDDVPRSEAVYSGDSAPAVLDSTSGTQSLGANLLWDLGYLAGEFGGGGIRLLSVGSTGSSASDYVEGEDGGSYTYEGSYSSSWSETSYNESTMQSLAFNDFADSSGVNINYYLGGGIEANALSQTAAVPLVGGPAGVYYENLQAGRGALYRTSTFHLTSDGIPSAEPSAVRPGYDALVGTILTDSLSYYSNYASFFTSEGHGYDGWSTLQRQRLQSGFASANRSGTYDTTLGVTSFEDTISADYAVDYFYSYENDYGDQYSDRYTQALLGFGQAHAWDLSTATFGSSGTYCAEGDAESYVTGCLDFDISMTWDNDASGEYYNCRGYPNPLLCYGQPVDGSMTLQAGGATASFAYTPGGTLFTFDAGDGSAVFQTTLPPMEPGPI